MKYFTQLLFILFISVLKAQTVNDSLIRLLSLNTTPDSVKIKLAGDISWNFLSNDIEKAMFYAKKELELAKKIDNKKEIAQANSDIGNVFNRMASFDSTLHYYNIALKIRQSLNDKIKSAGIYSNIATVYTRQSKFKEALDLNFKSLKLYEQIGDSANQANILGNIGILYYNLEQNKSANEFFIKGLRIARLCHKQLIEANILIELGGIKFEQGVKNDIIVNRKELDSALLYFENANTILTEYNAIYNLAVVNNNIGRIYVQLKDYEKATQYYNQGLIYRQQMNDDYGIGLSYLNLGKISKLKKLYPNSIDFYKKAATIFLEIKSYVDLKQVYGEMSVAYEDMKDYHNAMIFHQLYAQYSDSVYTSENAKQMAEMQTKYEVDKKDLELAKNKAELEAKEKQAFIKNIIIISVVLLLLLLSGLGILFYRKKQIEQQAKLDAEIANQKEIRTKAILDAEEKERRRIAQDLHDGVGQLLSAAKLNLSNLDSKLIEQTEEQKAAMQNALNLVDDSVKEVRLVSHNMMPNTLIKLGLGSAVREFITKLGNAPNLKIDLEIVGLDTRLENQVETVLYRVIQEIVNNIIKHAKASHISMQLIRHETEMNVMIEDNGIGFDTSKLENFEGIGLKGIQTRIEFLNGSVHFDSSIGRGTTVIIDIPLV
ncbi:MAG TPA: sensor histidine kinase [Bacteroidia bacterium]|nr:sensor histidine kinase [Bacteroidia bacterium]